MARIHRLALFAISVAVLLAGCGQSNENEYAIARLADMITVYWVLPANSEVANFELKDNVLELEVDTGELQEKKKLSIPIGAERYPASFTIAENHEILEIKGMRRLDELAIFHIMANPTMESTSGSPFKTHIMWKWIDGKWQESPQIVPFTCAYTSSRPDRYLRHIGDDDKPGNFTQAETFRSGDRITAYWHSPSKPGKWFNQGQAEKGYTSGGIGERAIGLPDNWIKRMSITNVEPHEDITCLGIGITPEIFIAYFRVHPNSTE